MTEEMFRANVDRLLARGATAEQIYAFAKAFLAFQEATKAMAEIDRAVEEAR